MKINDDLNFFDILDDNINNELKEEIPIVSTLRIFNNNPLFIFKFKIKYKCNGLCRYKNETVEETFSLPYLNLDENKFNNDRNKTIDDIIFKDIFEPGFKNM